MYQSWESDFLKCRCQNLIKPGHCVSPAEVAEFENGGLWIQQQILGLDVPMTDPERMDVGQAPEQLVHVQLHTDTHTHTYKHSYDYMNSKLSFHYRG